MRSLLLLIFLGAGVTLSLNGQVDPAATHAIDEMLQGARVIELPEGKALVLRNTWGPLDLPIFSDEKLLLETTFNTDYSHVRGVRRLVELTGTGDSDGLLTVLTKNLRDIEQKSGHEVAPLRPTSQRFLVIAYQDLATKSWKVSSVTSDTDTSANVTNRQNFEKPDRSTALGAMPSLKRYWFAVALIQDGQLMRARSELEGCIQISRKEKAGAVFKASEEAVNALLAEIASVIGPKN